MQTNTRSSHRLGRRLRALILITCALCLGLPLRSAAQSVFVQGPQNGQGVLRARGSECFVITPYHVVESSVGPLRIIAERAVLGAAELLRRLPDDLAVLRVTDRSTMRCGEMATAEDSQRQIRSQPGGTLNIVESDGSITLIPVRFRALDDEAIYIEPSRTGDQIQATMSGASLVVNGAFAGMLLSTDNGVGRVLQVDDLLRLSEGFFATDARSSRNNGQPQPFAGDGIQARPVRLALSANGASAVLTVEIENTSGETLFFALAGQENVVYTGEFSRFALVTVSDDQANAWEVVSVSGVPTLKLNWSRQSDFAAINAGGRSIVTFRFKRELQTGAAPVRPGSFSLSAQAASYGATGVKRIPIAFADIPTTSSGRLP